MGAVSRRSGAAPMRQARVGAVDHASSGSGVHSGREWGSHRPRGGKAAGSEVRAGRCRGRCRVHAATRSSTSPSLETRCATGTSKRACAGRRARPRDARGRARRRRRRTAMWAVGAAGAGALTARPAGRAAGAHLGDDSHTLLPARTRCSRPADPVLRAPRRRNGDQHQSTHLWPRREWHRGACRRVQRARGPCRRRPDDGDRRGGLQLRVLRPALRAAAGSSRPCSSPSSSPA